MNIFQPAWCGYLHITLQRQLSIIEKRELELYAPCPIQGTPLHLNNQKA